MRIAIVSDIHGNLTALEAVLADLTLTSPDLVFHGGDLAHAGARPAEVVDRIRDLGWAGVSGNTDEMLWASERLQEFAARAPKLKALSDRMQEMMLATNARLGEQRLGWLKTLPFMQRQGPVVLLHASPNDLWRAPLPDASDAELTDTYGPLESPVAVYGHIHRPFVRKLPLITVANAGSVSLSYDGDCRAAYLLLEETTPVIRRVEYDLDRESKALLRSALPHAEWVARTLRAGHFIPPD